MDMQTNRFDAASVGATYYFTGKRCKQGHLSPRRTIGGGCTECYRLNSKKLRDKIKRIFAEAVAQRGA